ncbi:MAG: hypothetical protein Q4G46_04480 [Propionibacteriaceae bacterium]|nr:hypothetical protein [Propionibacteriaceae bacterium]
MEPLVVSFNPQAQSTYRSFWTGPLGTAALIAPGVIVIVGGLILWLTTAEGVTNFFAAVVVFSGFYAAYAGWDHRRKAERGPATDPLAFVIAPDGVAFPRGKKFEWDEVRFVVTTEEQPRLLVTPVGAAYSLADLDQSAETIGQAVREASGGTVHLEQER